MAKSYRSDSQLVRMVITGSVDDGKSTLVGRILMDLGEIYEDQLGSIEETSFKQGMDRIDPSLITDGLSAEREQKITIDVAYRYLNTERRRFIIADVPGHEQYTRNMISGASDANLSMILVDVRKGLTVQSKRHLFIMSMLSIRHIVVIINKMDLVGYRQEVYQNIRDQFIEYASKLDIYDLEFIPISAFNGDMVVERKTSMNWYQGPTVFGFLEYVEVASDRNLIDFRFPVQFSAKDSSEKRTYAGQIEGGVIQTGESVLILPSMRKSTITNIILDRQQTGRAVAPQNVMLMLKDEIDISRGDVIARENNIPDIGHSFESMVCWMGDEPLREGTELYIKHTTQTARAWIDKIVYRIDLETLHRKQSETLELNDIGRVHISVNTPLIFDPYTKNKTTGSFILIDDISKQTVGAGVIRKGLKQTTTPNNTGVHLKKGGVVWFTGLPSSGKSTLADALNTELKKWNLPIERLDGDILRESLSRDLGFSAEDRRKNIERVTFVSKILARNSILVLASFVSPKAKVRDWARSEIGDFIEVYVKCPLQECIDRDPKGNYKKALVGTITNFTGISDPYEEPVNPDIVIETDQTSIEEAVNTIIAKLHELGYLEETTR